LSLFYSDSSIFVRWQGGSDDLV